MDRFVWDTSALLNIKEPNALGYSPAASFLKDLRQGAIGSDYQHLFPVLAVYEASASLSRKLRQGLTLLREFYVLDDHSRLYSIDETLVRQSADLFVRPGFDQLRGADLVFACIAHVEGATLVTMDNGFRRHVGASIDVLDLNDSRDEARYRCRFQAGRWKYERLTKGFR